MDNSISNAGDILSVVPTEHFSQHELLEKFSYRPMWTVRFSISTKELSLPECTPIDASRSSLGDLDVFPREVLDLIAVHMDIRSLLSFSLVNRKGKSVFNSCKEFRYFMKHASRIVVAILRTGVDDHSVLTLCQKLHDGRCVCCGEFGPYLFIPTCQRVCYICMERNPAFWVVPLYEAHGYFGFERHEARQIPSLYSIPGERHRRRDCPFRLKVASVRRAKEYSIQLHGPEKAREIWLKARADPSLKENDRAYVCQLQDVQLGPPYGKHQLLKHYDRLMTGYRYHRMATIAFPWMRPDGTLETGGWCRPCDWVSQSGVRDALPQSVTAAVIGDEDPREYWRNGSARAWTKEEFLEHMKSCIGLATIISTFDAADWEGWRVSTDRPW